MTENDYAYGYMSLCVMVIATIIAVAYLLASPSDLPPEETRLPDLPAERSAKILIDKEITQAFHAVGITNIDWEAIYKAREVVSRKEDVCPRR